MCMPSVMDMLRFVGRLSGVALSKIGIGLALALPLLWMIIRGIVQGLWWLIQTLVLRPLAWILNSLWSIFVGIFVGLWWMCCQVGYVIRDRSQDLWKGLLKVLFGTWLRCGMTAAIGSVVLATHFPITFGPLLEVVVALVICGIGMSIVVRSVFPKTAKKKSGKKKQR